jgi:hypothetical protein
MFGIAISKMAVSGWMTGAVLVMCRYILLYPKFRLAVMSMQYPLEWILYVT